MKQTLTLCGVHFLDDEIIKGSFFHGNRVKSHCLLVFRNTTYTGRAYVTRTRTVCIDGTINIWRAINRRSEQKFAIHLECWNEKKITK
jgi:hypothetical protein